jgi:hypothetical protein
MTFRVDLLAGELRYNEIEMTILDRVALGLTDLDGRLGRPADSSRWVVPGVVDLYGDRLTWRRTVDDWGDPARLRRGSPELLIDFIAVSASGDPRRRLLAFVRRWGVLELCSRHGLPPAHPPKLGEPRDIRRCEPERSDGDEPTEVYFRYAREAEAVLDIATDLAAGRDATGTRGDWAVLGIPDPGRETIESLRDTHEVVPLLDDPTPVFTPRGLAQFWLRLVLRDWIELGDVRPEIDLGTGVTIVFGGEGLFAAIAAQLLLAATRTEGVVICSSCGTTFSPTRRPRAGEARYCSPCRNSGKAGADSARRHRATGP